MARRMSLVEHDNRHDEYRFVCAEYEGCRDYRRPLAVKAALPVVGWSLWACGAATLAGNPIGGLMVLAVGVAVAIGLFSANSIIEGLSLTAAWMYAIIGWAIPFATGGESLFLIRLIPNYTHSGRQHLTICAVLSLFGVVSGIFACYRMTRNDTDLYRHKERLENLARETGQPLPWEASVGTAGDASDELDVPPGWDESKR
ncbi:MAG: hypothetical protein ACREJ2_07545 [Planctomycetota bacterium]